ncbi:2-methylcitrate dehydratase [Bordetella genomosp. 9]|uniref:2-methylcitrate dehydratase n=1 Tax=Bordetella genomosp. 9 TaxID=1416803 RepID=A0A261RMX6_9BORD|nr:MmgE/PrpD family protein [Bordetella genomosp. 9]OZI26251.1 2-methylcitrate dehydratase [Bordetella genomosp. 9]
MLKSNDKGIEEPRTDVPRAPAGHGAHRAPDAGLALRLGRYVAGLDTHAVDEPTREAVWRCLLDALASAGAALDLPAVRAARETALALYGRGAVPMWFTGKPASTAAALFANSAATAALDLDDGYRQARGHPGAAVIPTALALMGEDPRRTVADLVAAIVAGYEVGLRLAMARPAYAPSGAWSGYAVVATAGKMLGLDPAVIAHALAIAAQTAPALPALAGIAGSDVKEGIAAGVAAGWAALRLAMAGYVGPIAVLDDVRLFDPDMALRDLGGTPLIRGTYFKPYGCCRHIHAPLDAWLHLRARHGLEAGDIAGMQVRTYRATFNLSNSPAPRTLVEAQYSVPYCLALCALRGSDALVPLQAMHLGDAGVRDLAARITVVHDAGVEALFPARSPASVTVSLKDGRRLYSPVMDPRGDPATPLGWAELETKFRVATRAGLSPVRQQAVLDAISDLRHGDGAPLARAVGASGVLDVSGGTEQQHCKGDQP